MEINPTVASMAQQAAPQGQPAQPKADVPTSTPAATQAQGAANAQPQELAQALKHLQDQVARNSSSITLRAGLNPNGDHPGQVLVELMDKATQQVFYQYYIPADQALQAAKSADRLTPGSLLSGKA